MKVITEGHRYEVENLDGSPAQVIQFIEKRAALPGEPAPAVAGQLVTVMDGTTNEELLLVLINRLQFLQKKGPCRENSIVITKLEESLMWLQKRTQDRKARGVEGTNAK
jgi:hypothetical protein